MSDYLTLAPIHEVLPRGKRVDSPTDLHRAVMALFGDLADSPRESASILFRIEQVPGRAPSLLIRSSVPPEHPTRSTSVRELPEPDYAPGQPVAFRIAINGVQRLAKGGIRSVSFDPDPSVGELDETSPTASDGEAPAMTPWLQAKLAGILNDITLINHGRTVLGVDRKGNKLREEDHAVQVDLIDGVATVGDPEALANAMARGVGRAKSYGCGLLTVKPLK